MTAPTRILAAGIGLTFLPRIGEALAGPGALLPQSLEALLVSTRCRRRASPAGAVDLARHAPLTDTYWYYDWQGASDTVFQ
jgi:hypothetical protein